MNILLNIIYCTEKHRILLMVEHIRTAHKYKICCNGTGSDSGRQTNIAVLSYRKEISHSGNTATTYAVELDLTLSDRVLTVVLVCVLLLAEKSDKKKKGGDSVNRD